MVQTYAGDAPLDLTPLSSALAVTGLLLLAVSAVLALRGLATAPGPRSAHHPAPWAPPSRVNHPAVAGGGGMAQ